MEISKKHLRIVPHHANKETVNGASYCGTTNNVLELDLSVDISSSTLAKIPDLLPTEIEMRAMLPVSVIDVRGLALGETATSMLSYFNLIVYLISNKMLYVSEDLFVLLEIALTRGPFLSLLLKKTPTTRAFVQELFESALDFRKPKIILILLDAELVFDAWISQPGYPLELAISERDTALSKRLIRAGADLTGDRGSEALTIAARMGNLELVSFLSIVGANPNPRDTSTCYPALSEAASRDDKEMVKLLLSYGADINTSSSYISRPSPLVSAAENGDLQLVQLLLDRGVHVEDRSLKQGTTLGIAVSQGYSELARELLDAGASAHPPAFNPLEPEYAESSALYKAVKEGHQYVAELLLTHKADPNTRAYRMDDPDATGRTVLFTAVTNQNKQIVRILLKAGARVNEMSFYETKECCFSREYRKETALHQAVRTSNTDLVHILLKAGAVAISPFSEVRLQSGSQYQDDFSYNTANLLARNPDPKITGLLFTADPSVILKYGMYFLLVAIRSNDIDLARILLEAGVNVNDEPIEYSHGTALQHSISAGNCELARVFLDYGANVNAPPRGNHGRTALQSAADIGSMEMVQMLLNHGADIHAPGTMEYGTAIQLAAQAGHVEVVELLLHFTKIRNSQANASSHYSNQDTASNDWQSTMLPAAAKGRLFELVRSLLTMGEDINTVLPGTQYGTALQEAVGQQDLEMVHFLLDCRADPNIPGPVRVGRYNMWRTGTALQTAVDVKNLELVRILIKTGAQADVLSSACEDRRTPLEAALEKFEGEDLIMLVRLLLVAGADVNLSGIRRNYLRYSEGAYVVVEKTMLSAAIHSGNVQLVNILIEAGADVNAVSTYKDSRKTNKKVSKSPLQDAVGLADLEISRVLLKAGADVGADWPSFCSDISMWGKAGMLATAIVRGNIELFQLLLDSGANVNSISPTEESITALEAASNAGHLDIVETLLRRGAEIDGNPGSRIGTALKCAVVNGHAGVAFALLEAGADPTLAHSDESESPLVKAAVNGRIDMLQMLLNATKSRGTSGQLYVELLESSLEIALEDTSGGYNMAIGMIKTEIEDSKSA
jgi:ankyrin repeat protein